MSKLTYTDQCGDVIEVECLEWLEDGSYWDEDEGDYCACARYCINTDDDGESVWLNDDHKEVDPEAEPDDEEEDEDDQGGDE